jgi:hypothetical protein
MGVAPITDPDKQQGTAGKHTHHTKPQPHTHNTASAASHNLPYLPSYGMPPHTPPVVVNCFDQQRQEGMRETINQPSTEPTRKQNKHTHTPTNNKPKPDRNPARQQTEKRIKRIARAVFTCAPATAGSSVYY